MKKLILILLLPAVIASGVYFFLEGRKEMQKEREREKPVLTPPRVKEAGDGVVIEFDESTLAISGLKLERATGPLGMNAIVTADGKAWYYAEVDKRVFMRKPCSSSVCAVSDEMVVTLGAQMLLSEERKNFIKIGEDSGGGQ